MMKMGVLGPFASGCCQVPEGGELLKDGTVRINVWASPRSLSTALMYSFAQVCTLLRVVVVVVVVLRFEPLYVDTYVVAAAAAIFIYI